MLNMFLISLQKDKYIIQVDHYKFFKIVLQNKIHEPLKYDKCIAKSKGHSEVFILFPRHYKSSFMNILFLDLHLSIFCYQIKI